MLNKDLTGVDPLDVLNDDKVNVAINRAEYIKDDNGNPMGIPVVLNGKMNSDKLFVTIDIELAGQVIHVQLGTDDFAVAIKGDFNGDMRVDAADAEYVLTLIAGNEYSEIADFNEDNEVNAADLEFILSIIAGK